MIFMDVVHSVYLYVNQRENLRGDEPFPVGESNDDDCSFHFSDERRIIQPYPKEKKSSVFQVLDAFFPLLLNDLCTYWHLAHIHTLNVQQKVLIYKSSPSSLLAFRAIL